MDNTILIWKYLIPALTENTDLTQYVNPDYIYPLAALEGTPFPYVIYRRDSLSPQYTKHIPYSCGWTNNIAISLSVYSDNYNEGAYIANLIRSILEEYSLENEDIKIHPIELVASNEYYSENGFEQRLVFSITAE